MRGAQAKEGRETLESLFLNEVSFMGYFSMGLFVILMGYILILARRK